MKKILVPIVCALTLSVLCLTSACTKPATVGSGACIAALVDSATVNQSINFVSCSGGVTAYIWDFGDGNTAASATTTHSYSATGTYHGSLTVYNSNGVSNVKTFTIVVYTPAGPGGSMTLNSVSYQLSTCDTSNFLLQANTGTSINSSFGLVAVQFYGGHYPTSSGTYTVSASPSAANQVAVLAAVGSGPTTYFCTGNVNSQTVSVTVSNGKISASSAAVQVASQQNASDIETISFHITQTQ